MHEDTRRQSSAAEEKSTVERGKSRWGLQRFGTFTLFLCLVLAGLWSQIAHRPTAASSVANLGRMSSSLEQYVVLDAVDDTYVWEAQADVPHGGEETFWVFNDPGARSRALLRFEGPAPPAGAMVTGAYLVLRMHPYSSAGGHTAQIETLNPLEPWDEEIATWNNQPSVDPAAPVVEDSFADYAPGAYDQFDITPLVNHALANGAAETSGEDRVSGTSVMSLILRILLEALSQEWYSKENTESMCPPRVYIYYETGGPSPTATESSSATSTNTPDYMVDTSTPTPRATATSTPSGTPTPTPTPTATPECGVDTVVEPVAEAGSASASPRTCRCGEEGVALAAVPEDGWAFHHWEQYGAPCGSNASCTVPCPGAGRETAVAVFGPILTLDGHRDQAICPPSPEEEVLILPFTLCASDADDWEVDAIRVKALGSGDDKQEIEAVKLYKGQMQLDGDKQYPQDNGTIQFDTEGFAISKGTCVDLSLHYRFRDMNEITCPAALDKVFQVQIAPTQVDANPIRYQPGLIMGNADGRTPIGCIINDSTDTVFGSIQEAIDDPSTVTGHVILVCPGTYEENVGVSKSLTVRSVEGRGVTVIQPSNANDHVVRVMQPDVTIRGFTVTDGRDTGIYVERGAVGGCEIAENRIEGNYHGLEIGALSGSGLASSRPTGGTDPIMDVSNNVIASNEEVGILANGSLNMRGGGNQIGNNGRSGIRATGDIAIDGDNNDVSLNGHEGIWSLNGSLHIAGSVTVNNNGTAWPSDEYVSTRVGGLGAEEGIVLEDVEACGNKGHGIYGHDCSVTVEGNAVVCQNKGFGVLSTWNITLRGTSHDISWNGRDGLFTGNGYVRIAGPAKISNNGTERSPGECLSGRVGGVTAEGKVVAEAIEAKGNCGVGIYSANSSVITKGDTDVCENTGHGIWALSNIGLKGSMHEISENGMDGLFAPNGFVQIEGIARLNDNGQTGIYGEGLKMGPGEVCRNDEYGIWVDDLGLDLEAVKVCSNQLGGIRGASNGGAGPATSALESLPGGQGEPPAYTIWRGMIVDNDGDGILVDDVGPLIITDSNLQGNGGFGVNNASMTMTVSAQGNWWGDPNGPAQEPGSSGEEITGTVEYAPWSSDPFSLTVLPETDPLLVPPDVPTSNRIYLQNWQHPSDRVTVTAAGTPGWLLAPSITTVTLEEGIGGSAVISVTVPGDVPLGTSAPVTVTASSHADPTASDTAIFHVRVRAHMSLPLIWNGGGL